MLQPITGSVRNAYGLLGKPRSLPRSVYGQFAILIFSAWAGTGRAGVIAGLAICGVVVAAVSQAAVLMQDFRTG